MKSRFAPSPTGKLHVGNIRTAIITWLTVRSMGGEFLLRIDDTDQERSKDEYTQAVFRDLEWLGLSYDETAHQKNRFDRYNDAIQTLKDNGRLYPCYETEDELALKRKSLLGRGLPPIYDRAALSLTDEQIAKFEAEGRKPHWRFKLNHAPIIWQDMVRGEVKFEGETMSDPVLIRADGTPLYHICSVIDDIDFGITHVVRGEDHVSNTASHIQMHEALTGKDNAITYAHLPLISDAEGGKLSKRLGSLSVEALREEEGLEPMALISLLSRLGSSDPVEPLTRMQQAIDGFDLTKFGRGTPKFDQQDLFRLNAKIVREMPFEEVQGRLGIGLDKPLWDTIRPNLDKVEDARELVRIVRGPVAPKIEEPEFADTAAQLLPPAPWDENTWSNWISAIKDKTDRKGKQLFMPLRQALTGMDHGPELANLLPLIGPEETKKRLNSHG